MMHWTVVVFLFSLIGFAFSDPIAPPIPVEETEQGHRFTPVEPRPAVLFELFGDLTCPDAAAAWPIVQQVQQYYGASRLDLVLQQIPIPHHRNGFLSTQGLFIVQDNTPDFLFDYVDVVHEHYAQFSTGQTVNKTEYQVVDELADLAVEVTGIDKDVFVNGIVGTTVYRTISATAYKYAIKRGAVNSPTYYVNGVELGTGTNYVPTFDDWIAFFDPIIGVDKKGKRKVSN